MALNCQLSVDDAQNALLDSKFACPPGRAQNSHPNLNTLKNELLIVPHFPPTLPILTVLFNSINSNFTFWIAQAKNCAFILDSSLSLSHVHLIGKSVDSYSEIYTDFDYSSPSSLLWTIVKASTNFSLHYHQVSLNWFPVFTLVRSSQFSMETALWYF